MGTTIAKPNDLLNPTLDEAAGKVGVLVADFRANEKYFLSRAYSEASVRKDYIDEFLFALGWDVGHRVQKNPFQQDVKVERIVATATAQRRADYALSVEPHFDSPVLYVEAKKPCDDIATPDNYFQSIRYGYQRGHTIGILTSFAQLHVIDCRFEPNIDTAINYGLCRYQYTDFAKPDKFDEIFFLISRPEVIRGSIEKFEQTLSKRKGRPGQKAFLPVAHKLLDEPLLEKLDDLRRDLARALKNRNARLESAELTELTQRILDRLVFIRFLEDKLIEPDPIIPTLGNSTGRTVWEDFLAASRRLDKIYNGVVFKHHSTLDDPGALSIDDKHFADVLDVFDFYKSKYLFNDIPLHILGSIYERFLGKVIVATAKRADLKDKPEVLKAGGVYYTPKYIVDYIVHNTVGKLIDGKTPDAIAKMRFADIACGSGSFLLGMYDCLLKYVTLWYNEHPNKAPKAAVVKRDGALHLTLKEKARILTNNIYGVDIDPQAVEVSQLSLCLKVLEEETTASARQYTLEFHRPLLPSLANNIKCGNSLIGSDFYENKQLDFFDVNRRRQVNAFDWEAEFPDIFKAGGFDAVIGNPPYFNMDDTWGKGDLRQRYVKKAYPLIYNDKTDILFYFLGKAVEISKLKVGYIVSRAFLEAYKADKLRAWLAGNTNIDHVLDFRNYYVFRGVGITTAILVLAKGNQRSKARVSLLRKDIVLPKDLIAQIAAPDVFQTIDVEQTAFGAAPWIFATEDAQKLGTKMDAAGDALGQVLLVGQGMQTGRNHVFGKLDGATIAKWKLPPGQWLIRARNSDIHRFTIRNRGEYLLYVEDVDRFDALPSKVRKHLEAYEGELKNRAAYRRGDCEWWKYTWPLHKECLERPRIYCPYLATTNRFALDANREYLGLTDTTVLYDAGQPENLRYLLGLLNSRLLTFRFRFIGKLKSGGIREYFWNSISKLPIRRIDFSRCDDKARHDLIVELVGAMLELHRQADTTRTTNDRILIQRQIVATDRRIDQIVYELYGLSEAEITIVEEASKEPLHEDAGVDVSGEGSATTGARTKGTRTRKTSSKNGATHTKKAGQKRIFD